MEQYKKLFEKSEIEYITPFLKLWMSFNNWYKKDLPNIKFDREAIKEYKKQGVIKDNFNSLFNSSSEEGIEFDNALFELILSLQNYDLKNHKDIDIKYNCIAENKDKRSGNYIYISQKRERFQIQEEEQDLFFEQTLDIIYCIRSNLVHGSFDIDNEYFIKSVENVYKILFPIMTRILQNQEEKIYFCKNKKGTNAKAKFIEGKMIVLKESKICEAHVPSYSGILSRYEVLRKNAVNKDNVFTLDKDIEFDSPSAASSFCLGKNSNGWDDWKNKNNQSMDEILR
jgi:hypothetical protein